MSGEKEKPPEWIIQEELPTTTLLNMENMEEDKMKPANVILNRTNFYDVMIEYTNSKEAETQHLLLSPQVYRDLSIFNSDALQRSIKMPFAFKEYPLRGYAPSPVLWWYVKEVDKDHPDCTHYEKETVLKKILNIGKFFLYFLCVIDLILVLLLPHVLYLLIPVIISMLLFITSCFLYCTQPMDELDVAFLQTCTMIDYVQC